MKNRSSVHLTGAKKAETHEKPHLQLLKESPSETPSERRSQEEDELRSLIKSLQRRDPGTKEEATYRERGKRKYSGLLMPEDDLPPAA